MATIFFSLEFTMSRANCFARSYSWYFLGLFLGLVFLVSDEPAEFGVEVSWQL